MKQILLFCLLAFMVTFTVKAFNVSAQERDVGTLVVSNTTISTSIHFFILPELPAMQAMHVNACLVATVPTQRFIVNNIVYQPVLVYKGPDIKAMVNIPIMIRNSINSF